MNPETKFGKILIEELEHQLKDLPYQIFRIESNLTLQGIPDIYCCVNGHSFWIELKVDGNPLSPMQSAWHAQHYLAGGTSFVVFREKENLGMLYSHRLQHYTTFPSLYELCRFILNQVEENAVIRHHNDEESLRSLKGNS